MTRPAALPTPTELGLPEKFVSFYDDQITAIDKAVHNPRRFTALALPTGSGKTLTGVTTALLHPNVKRALYLTSTKGLQDQALEFGQSGMIDIRGQRNYPCHAVQPGQPLDWFYRGRRTIMVDEGPCHAGVPCASAPNRNEPHIRPSCVYYGTVHDARRAQLVSTNYSMYLTSTEYAEGFGNFDLIILDEAHDADKELESFLTLEITLDDVHLLGSKMLKSAEVAGWRDWANHHRGQLASKIERREAHPPQDTEGVRDLRALKTLLGKLERLSGIDPFGWILDADGMRARFAPIRVAQYAEQYLFRNIPHVLLMSATMTRKTTQMLGIPSDNLTFWECPSRFALERRPVINVNTHPGVQVRGKMTEDDKFVWLRRIDRLIEPRRALGRKGIIHTVSYQRMRDLLTQSEHRDLMLTHDAANTRDTIQMFKQSDKPHILVSPSVVTGFDFPGSQCRYQVIAKVPIPDMRGPIMSARAQIDPDYSGYLAIQKLIQACGRGMRGPDDWCECLIVDDTMEWFLPKYRKHAPKWFTDSVSWTDVYPEPIEVE